MLRVLESYENLEACVIDTAPCIVIRNAVFKKNFGPWHKGEYVDTLRYDAKVGVLSQLDNEGHIVNAQKVCFVSENKQIMKFAAWLDNNEANHLHTTDGEKVYEIYEKTDSIKAIRQIAEEMR